MLFHNTYKFNAFAVVILLIATEIIRPFTIVNIGSFEDTIHRAGLILWMISEFQIDSSDSLSVLYRKYLLTNYVTLLSCMLVIFAVLARRRLRVFFMRIIGFRTRSEINSTTS